MKATIFKFCAVELDFKCTEDAREALEAVSHFTEFSLVILFYNEIRNFMEKPFSIK